MQTVSLDPLDSRLEAAFELSAGANVYGWNFEGVKTKRGKGVTLKEGAGVSWTREVDGSEQTLSFWPSTGTTESRLLHPSATEPKQLYRAAISENAKDLLHKLFANPRAHTDVGYYFNDERRFLERT